MNVGALDNIYNLKRLGISIVALTLATDVSKLNTYEIIVQAGIF